MRLTLAKTNSLGSIYLGMTEESFRSAPEAAWVGVFPSGGQRRGEVGGWVVITRSYIITFITLITAVHISVLCTSSYLSVMHYWEYAIMCAQG